MAMHVQLLLMYAHLGFELKKNNISVSVWRFISIFLSYHAGLWHPHFGSYHCVFSPFIFADCCFLDMRFVMCKKCWTLYSTQNYYQHVSYLELFFPTPHYHVQCMNFKKLIPVKLWEIFTWLNLSPLSLNKCP